MAEQAVDIENKEEGSEVVELTAEQEKMVRQATEDIVKDIASRVDKVKKDVSGIEALKYAMDLTSTKASNGAKKGDGKDDEKDETHADAFSVIFDGLKDFAKKMLEWAGDFIKALVGADIGADLKLSIGEQCSQYKNLLGETLESLQAYRLHTEDLQAFINALAKLIVPSVKALGSLKALSKDKASEKLNQFASKNQEKAGEKIKELNKMIDTQRAHANKIAQLQKKWGKMAKGFEHVQVQVTQQAKEKAELKKKAEEGGRSSIFFGWISGAVSTIIDFGKSVIDKISNLGWKDILGVGIQVGQVGLQVVADIYKGKPIDDALLNGLTAYVPWNEFKMRILSAQKLGITAVQDALTNIAASADRIETLLQLLYHQSVELEAKLKRVEDANETAENVFAMGDDDAYDGIEGLYAILFSIVEQLESLSGSIKEAEDTCKELLVSYTDNIYTPLLKLMQDWKS